MGRKNAPPFLKRNVKRCMTRNVLTTEIRHVPLCQPLVTENAREGNPSAGGMVSLMLIVRELSAVLMAVLVSVKSERRLVRKFLRLSASKCRERAASLSLRKAAVKFPRKPVVK